jgi:heavy metal sensor kinase
MRRLLASTRGRLVLTYAGLLAAAILAADTALALALTNAEQGEVDQVLRSQAAVVVAGIEDVNGTVHLDVDLPTETAGGIAVAAAVVAPDGTITKSATQSLSPSTLTALATAVRQQHAPVWRSLRDSHGVPWRVYAEPLRATQGQGTGSVVVVNRSTAELQAGLAQTFLFLAIFSAVIVAGGTFLAYRLTSSVLLPVKRIAAMARSMSEHDLHRRVDVKVPPDEMGELVQTFNAMLARLEAGFESLRRFTADASHELRSPLTLMRSELEGALARPRTPAEYVRVLDEIDGEVNHMARLVDQLLMLARADAGALQPARVPVDVADLLHEAGARWRPMAEGRQVSLDVEAPDSGTLSADPDLLRRVFDNLLDNAIRHSPPGTTVRLRGTREAHAWALEVTDEGPGIPEGLRTGLFERFARLDRARGRDTGGAGLGLALSRAIAESHGGRLDLVGRNTRGAAFRLVLPDAGPEPAYRAEHDARVPAVPISQA